jgi:tRNA(Ile)-lysidine synthetase-like protein
MRNLLTMCTGVPHRWRALPAVTRLDQLHAFVEAHTRSGCAYATLRELAARAESPDGRPRWSAHINATWRLVRSGDRLRVQQWSGSDTVTDRDEDGVTTTSLGTLRVHHPAAWRVTLRIVDGDVPTAATEDKDGSVQEGEWWSPALRKAGMTLHRLPADAELTLRTRRDGDRFTPHWRAGGGGAARQGKTWKLKDLLRETGMPIHVRDTLPLVTLGSHLVAVYPAWVDAAVRRPPTGVEGGVCVHLTIEDA